MWGWILETGRRPGPAIALTGALASALLLAGCIPDGGVPPPETAPAPPLTETEEAPPRLETETDEILLNPSPPTWEARPVSVDARRVAQGFYVVQPGDTLRGIGNRTGAGSEALALANDIGPPFTIMPGQRLIVPGGLYHQVRDGETGIAIAQAYGVPWADVVEMNGLEAPYILRINQRLRLPEGARSEAPEQPLSRAERAAAFTIGIDDIVTGSQPALAEGSAAAAPTETMAAAPNRDAIQTPLAFDGRFRWPADGKVISGFGNRGDGRVNQGINIGLAEGDPIRAAADGVVSYAGDEIGVFGGLVLIDHGQGWITAYGHASKLDVVRGQKVRAGQVIGAGGQTGYVTEPQLHFEIRKDREPVDPRTKLPAR